MNKKNFRQWKTNSDYQLTSWGLSNDSYLLDKKYVLRKAKIENLFSNIQQEKSVLSLITNYNITFPILDYWQSDTHYYLVTALNNHKQTWWKQQLTTPLLKRVAKLIDKLHQIPLNKIKIIELNLVQHLEKHWKINNYEDNFWIKKCYQLIRQFLQSLKTEKNVLSHNDIVKENVFLTPEQDYLIDFEYATINHPICDFACFAAEAELWKNSELWKNWLKLSQINDATTLRLFVYFVWYRLLIGYLWADYYLKTTKKMLYQTIKNTKLNIIIEFGQLKIAEFMKNQ